MQAVSRLEPMADNPTCSKTWARHLGQNSMTPGYPEKLADEMISLNSDRNETGINH